LQDRDQPELPMHDSEENQQRPAPSAPGEPRKGRGLGEQRRSVQAAKARPSWLGSRLGAPRPWEEEAQPGPGQLARRAEAAQRRQPTAEGGTAWQSCSGEAGMGQPG
jgi:hypothetical protein